MGPATPQGEFALIDWIRRQQAGRQGRRTAVGIGDDCAVLDLPPGCQLLATTDMLMDGRHFRLNVDGAEAVGYKAMGVNLSDIAAMAGVPLAALVSVALPRGAAVPVGQGLLAGLKRMAERFDVGLIGGDTNAWDGPLVINVAVLGEAAPAGPVRRSGARPGDVILVTGPLGGSLCRGRHLRPEPRIREALALLQAAPLGAMIDISDGLSSDLGHILAESGGLGAVLDAAAIPIHADAVQAAREDGIPALRARAARRRGLRALPHPGPGRRRFLAGGASHGGPALPRGRDHRRAGAAAAPGGWEHFPAGAARVQPFPGCRGTRLMKVSRTGRVLSVDLHSEQETEELGAALARMCKPGCVIGLAGPLGAGKTRLVRALAESLGVDPAAIASPTFVLIHEYQGRMPVYHFDVYRLRSAQEFDDLGVCDYWNAGGVCLIEWADRVQPLLPADTWSLTIEPSGPCSRHVEISFPAAADGADLADHLARGPGETPSRGAV